MDGVLVFILILVSGGVLDVDKVIGCHHQIKSAWYANQKKKIEMYGMEVHLL